MPNLKMERGARVWVTMNPGSDVLDLWGSGLMSGK